MNVSDIMTKEPVTVRLDDTLRTALEIMERVNCRHLPVISMDGHLLGILSDRDCREALNSPFILRERWQDSDLIDHLQARAIMTPAPVTVEPHTAATEAARLMLVNHISALPVLRSETLVGIVTTSDILIAFMEMRARVKRRQDLDSSPISNS